MLKLAGKISIGFLIFVVFFVSVLLGAGYWLFYDAPKSNEAVVEEFEEQPAMLTDNSSTLVAEKIVAEDELFKNILPLPQALMNHLLEKRPEMPRENENDRKQLREEGQALYATRPREDCFQKNMQALEPISQKITANIASLTLSPADFEAIVYTFGQLPGLSNQVNHLVYSYHEAPNKVPHQISKEVWQLFSPEEFQNGIAADKLISVIESDQVSANDVAQVMRGLYSRLDVSTIDDPEKISSRFRELGIKPSFNDFYHFISRNQRDLDDDTLLQMVQSLYKDIDLSQAHLVSRYDSLLSSITHSSRSLELLNFLSDRGLQFNKPVAHRNEFFTPSRRIGNDTSLVVSSSPAFSNNNFLDDMLRFALYSGAISEKNIIDVLDFMASKGVYPTNKSILEKNLGHQPELKHKLESIQDNIKQPITLKEYVAQNINTKKYERMMGVDKKIKRSLLNIKKKNQQCKLTYENKIKQWEIDNKDEIDRVRMMRGNRFSEYQSSMESYTQRKKEAQVKLREWISKNKNKKNTLRMIDAYLIHKNKLFFFIGKYSEYDSKYQPLLNTSINESRLFDVMENDTHRLKTRLINNVKMNIYEQHPVKMMLDLLYLLIIEDVDVFKVIKEEKGFDSDFYRSLQEAFKLFVVYNETLPNSVYFKKLESLGVDLYRTDDEGGHLLSYAAMNNDVSLVDDLLKNKKSLKYNPKQINALDIALIQFTPENKAVLHSLIKANYPMDEFHKQLINRLKKQYPKAANKIL